MFCLELKASINCSKVCYEAKSLKSTKKFRIIESSSYIIEKKFVTIALKICLMEKLDMEVLLYFINF